MNGDETGKALEANPNSRWIEAVGPLLALPDLAMSGRAALRKLAAASTPAGRATRPAGSAERLAGNDACEFRGMMADPDQSATLLVAARQSSGRRAAQYRRLQTITRRINQDLVVKGNAAPAYGAGLYALQPPELTRRLMEGHPPPAAAAGSNTYALLAPANGSAPPGRPSGHMQVTAVVATRGSRSR